MPTLTLRLAAALLTPGFLAAAAGAEPLPVPAQDAPPIEEVLAEPVQASLVAATSEVAPGKVVELGLLFDIAPEWHLYGAAQNDTGFPIKVKLSVPPGCKAQPMLWPVPVRHVSAGDLLDHVYVSRVLLIAPVEIPADAKPGAALKFGAQLDWLVCRQLCLSGSTAVTLKLTVAHPGNPLEASEDEPLFAATRARLPQPIPPAAPGAKVPLTATLKGDELTLEAPGADRLTLVPDDKSATLQELRHHGVVEGDRLTITLDPNRKPHARITGCVEVRYPPPARKGDGGTSTGETRFYALDLPASPDGKAPQDSPSVPEEGDSR